ncbi:hypothetical protein BOTBODRAFT_138825 [Botryobasidium botryosum FD-172 SS1]|uniref:Heme haloperoxidase family profile domain-containing protein n=1 Tax=Botryobasidium botryosum (strain FD-172 SS1) TaxID=930990 RepID=A0A067LYR3_BOTB1|nr:hypothetical protein BOTBODRAFT_138825 [Botryobasidium botryosum FD-172 SS1]
MSATNENINLLDDHRFIQPTASDSRSPCPALNTLANHGFLPRDGKNISALQLIRAQRTIYNISLPLASILAVGGILFCGHFPGKLDLQELAKHGRIEHDASLVHSDASSGDTITVDHSLLEELLRDSTDGRGLSLQDFAKARVRRQQHLPGRKLDGIHEKFACGESVLAHAVFCGGDAVHGEAPLDQLRVWLGRERLPEGWVGPQESFGILGASKGIQAIQAMIVDLQNKRD